MIELASSTVSGEKAASALAVIEVRSVIRRRQFAGDTSQAEADEAISYLLNEAGRLVEHPVNSAILMVASSLLDRQRLRSLDAIQLATALLASSALKAPHEVHFICSDAKLSAAAAAEGLTVWDPTHP